MNRLIVACVLATGTSAAAHPVLWLDINTVSCQAVNAAGVPSAFGGSTHTGALRFTVGAGSLNDLYIQSAPGGPFASAGLSGASLTEFSGQIDVVNGEVTGGNLVVGLSTGDVFTTVTGPGIRISYWQGATSWKVETYLHGGMFTDPVFGNVGIAPWFEAQGGGLDGYAIGYLYNPNAQGLGTINMDLFVDAIPAPGGWVLAVPAGVVALVRRRRTAHTTMP